MKTTITILSFILLLCCFITSAQDKPVAQTDRSRLSIMVVPFSLTDNVLEKMEKDPGYKEAISGINSALINMGYRNTIDFKTQKEKTDLRHSQTHESVRSDDIKRYIEDAQTDVIIEAEIIWTDPPSDPRSRQARLKLKAIDKYTGAVYADNSFIQSMQREFPNLAVAVNHALTKDGAEQFNKFLEQLDMSYKTILLEGRAVNIKFELDTKSRVTLNDRVDGERLSDRLEECLQKLAFQGRYRALGSSASYMDFSVQVPVVNESGIFVSPNLYLRKKVDTYFYQLGFDVDYEQVNNWISFRLIQKANPAVVDKIK